MNEKNDHYLGKLQREENRKDEADRQRKLVEARVKELKDERRARGFSVNAAVEDEEKVSKKIRVLENRLDKALVKFNQALSGNKALREEIDNLRRERVVFDGIYTKLEAKLREKKKKMGKIIDQSTAAYEARDNAQEAMNKLKEAHIKDMSQIETEMMEWNRKLKFDRRVKNFIGIKETDRQGQHRTLSGARKKDGKGYGAKNKSNADQLGEKLREYMEAFDKIQAATGITETDELVSTFREVEDQNFSLFNFVNDLQSEIEHSEERIAKLQAEIERIERETTTTGADRKRRTDELSRQLDAVNGRFAVFEDKYNNGLKTINNLKAGITSLFATAECDDSTITNRLGDAGISETNIMEYLSLIEQRTNEIILSHTAMKIQQGVDDGQADRSKKGSTANLHMRTRVQIQPPSTLMDGGDHDDESDSSEDEALIPVTRSDLEKPDRKMAVSTNPRRSTKQRSRPRPRF